jgi:hypothetical protein
LIAAGNEITAHMSNKDVGYSDRLPGVSDGTPFDIFAMKEPD